MSRWLDDPKQMDGTTSAVVCKAIGKGLRQTLSVDVVMFPARLQNLLDELRRQDNDASPCSN